MQHCVKSEESIKNRCFQVIQSMNWIIKMKFNHHIDIDRQYNLFCNDTCLAKYKVLCSYRIADNRLEIKIKILV